MKKFLGCLLGTIFPYLVLAQSDNLYYFGGERRTDNFDTEEVMRCSQDAGNVYDNPHTCYVDGEQLFVYDTEKMFISAIARITDKSYGFGSELKIAFSIQNKEKVPVDFYPEETRAYEMRKSRMKELKVYSSKEYLKKVQRNILWFGPDNVENAATVEIEVKDGIGNRLGSVSTKAKVYTGAADEAYDSAEKSVKETYLKRNTLFQGKEVNGVLVIGKPKGNNAEVHLKVGEDIYVFNFELTE